MAVFAYRALGEGLRARSARGTIVADTPRAARDELRGRGLDVTEITPVRQRRRQGEGGRRRAQSRVIGFIRELATLLRAGIPLLEALKTLSRQYRGRFRAMIQSLQEQVAAGTSLADAFAARGEYFDNLAVSITAVGENTGSLEEALEKLAGFKEKTHRLRNRVLTALLYPLIVTVIGLGVMVFLMTYVVPNLLTTLVEAGRPLPAITQFVKSCSDGLRMGWPYLLVGSVGAIAALKALHRTEAGRRLFDRVLLGIPLFGELVRRDLTSRMAVMLSALLRAGLPFVEAVRITRATLGNRCFQRALADYEKAVTAGRDVATALGDSGVFRPVVVQMLAVGQTSGELETMLDQLADSYDRQVETATARLTAVAEPLLIVLLAVMVGFIAFATILPILEASHVLE